MSELFSSQGHVELVTGGASGIGRMIAADGCSGGLARHPLQRCWRGLGRALRDVPGARLGQGLRPQLKRPFFLTQSLLALLDASHVSNESKVIGIAFIDGPSINMLQTDLYTATQAAMLHLTRWMALELIRGNIVVRRIAPGPFAFDMNREARERLEMAASRIPAWRIGLAEDVAPAVIHLESNAGDYVAGEILVFDGGSSHVH